MKETFCELEFFNDYMHLCCEASDDPATQQDCLCNPLNYGLEAEMTDNVGVDEVPTPPGARRAGNFAKPPKRYLLEPRVRRRMGTASRPRNTATTRSS